MKTILLNFTISLWFSHSVPGLQKYRSHNSLCPPSQTCGVGIGQFHCNMVFMYSDIPRLQDDRSRDSVSAVRASRGWNPGLLPSRRHTYLTETERQAVCAHPAKQQRYRLYFMSSMSTSSYISYRNWRASRVCPPNQTTKVLTLLYMCISLSTIQTNFDMVEVNIILN